MPSIVFRTHASVAIGGGHMFRCLALADELQSFGWSCGFAIDAGTLDVCPQLERQGLNILDLPGDAVDDPGALFNHWDQGVDWLVVDNYAIDHAFEAACRPWARRILVIDDLANRHHDCDVLIDQNLGRTPEHYAGLTPDGCELLLGPVFALLRDQFAIARDAARTPNNPAGRPILISIGATDPGNLSLRMLNALGSAGNDRPVNVVLGGTSPHKRDIADAAGSFDFPVTLRHDVKDMGHLLSECGLAIGAGGISSWERCCLGIPTLMVISADNQRFAARELEKAGAVSLIEDIDGLSDDALTERVRRFIDDDEALAVTARAAERICDGRGVRRAAMAINPASTKDGGRVRLRPVTMADTDVLLAWQRDPRTRRFFIETTVPTEDQHRAWMRQKLSAPTCILNMVLHDGSPSGVVRMELLDTHAPGPLEYKISIHTAPDKYRLGIGRAALELGRRLLPYATFVAHILADNKASQTLFRNAGYDWQSGQYVSRADTPRQDNSQP